MAEIAARLNVSRQTLFRQLRAEGVTFEQVLDELRRRQALRLLAEEDASIAEIAYRLGFSDPAAFAGIQAMDRDEPPRGAGRRTW
jgi:AraC-like DNA-binding protein